MTKAWLITGSASGLRRDVAEAALAAGNRVVATARRPGELQDLVDRYDAKVRTVKQDVRNSQKPMPPSRRQSRRLAGWMLW